MEHVASCALCIWQEGWTTNAAAEAAAVWHVYHAHPEVWLEKMGSDRPPDVAHGPESYGRKLAGWERQLIL